MTEKEPEPLAKLVDEVLANVIAECPDPRAAEFKRQFDEAVESVRQQFERWKADSLAARTAYHEACGLPRPEAERAAEADVSPLIAAAIEEREQLVAHHWAVFLRRLQAVLDETEDEA